MRKFTSFLLTAVLSCGLLVGQVCSATTLGGVDQSAYYGYKVGDVNNNGRVESADLKKLKELVLEGASAKIVPAGDLNKDGKLNSLDTILLKDKILNLDDSACNVNILLDAGHFGYYNKYTDINYYESQFSWKLYTALRTELQSYGFTVHGTRTSQDNLLTSTSTAVTGEASYTKFSTSDLASTSTTVMSNSLRGRGL